MSMSLYSVKELGVVGDIAAEGQCREGAAFVGCDKSVCCLGGVEVVLAYRPFALGQIERPVSLDLDI